MTPLFFDLDGTLTDPKPGITGSVIAALTRLGLPAPSPDELEWVIGPALIDSFRKLGTPDPAEALALYREVYAAEGMLACTLYSGIADALATLATAGHRMYLMTSKPLVYASQIIAHFDLERHFDGQYGAELDGTFNDKRALLAHALRELGLSDGVMIGDRSFDIAAARANGLPALAVTWGYGTEAERSEADAQCRRPADLPAAIRALRPPVSA